MSETVKLWHPTAASCSWAGVQIDRNEDGTFEVPPEAVGELSHHGFTDVPAAPLAGPAIPTGNPAKWTKDVLEAEAVRLGIDPALRRSDLLKAVAKARKDEADAADAEQDHAVSDEPVVPEEAPEAEPAAEPIDPEVEAAEAASQTHRDLIAASVERQTAEAAPEAPAAEEPAEPAHEGQE